MKKILILLAAIACIGQANAQTIKGHRYRGFIDTTFLTDGVFEDMNSIGGGFSTSHGYQFNPYIFLGGGVAYHSYSLDDFFGKYSIPIFTNFRVNMNDKKISPFFDAKLGYSVGNYEGAYVSPTFGVRFGLKQDVGLNVSIGYAIQGYEYIDYYVEKSYIHSLTLSVGVDF